MSRVCIYIYIRTCIVLSDQRPPIEEVKGESSMLRHPSCFTFPYMLGSMIVDRANLWVKCEIESLFAVHTCYENSGHMQRVQNIHTGIQSDCPIVLQIAKQEEDSTCEMKCRSPRA